MSFNFSVQGTKEECLEQLENTEGQASGDSQHFDLAKESLQTAIENAPDNAHISANASGHHDYETSNPNGNFQISFTVKADEQQATRSKSKPAKDDK